MPLSETRKDRPFDRPGKYRIRVQGYLDESRSERLAGMTINTRQGSRGQITMLVGRLRDQAELSGVLNTLYELHLTIISVECLEDD